MNIPIRKIVIGLVPLSAIALLSCTPSLIIQKVQLSGITQTSAIISWNTNELSTSEIAYGYAENSYGNIIKNELLSCSHEIKLEWLLPGTIHHFKIGSYDAHGQVAITDDNTFSTNALPEGKGIIVGTVILSVGGLANDVFVYIFKDEGLQSLAYYETDDSGRYVFTDLPYGKYEIYSSNMQLGGEAGGSIDHVYRDLYRSFNLSPERVAVTTNQLVIAPTRTHFRDMTVHLQEEYINTNQPKISWDPVPTAAYYMVRIADGYLNESGHEQYEGIFRTSDAYILWSQQLIEMHYVINIYAYDYSDQYLTDVYDSFWIGSKP